MLVKCELIKHKIPDDHNALGLTSIVATVH
jgi:hypothetical protein